MQKVVIFLVCCFWVTVSLFAKSTNPQQKKVLICGVCKNVEAALPNTIQCIEALGNNFREYAVIIYENNSSDKTAKILADWAKKNKRVIFISENLTNQQLSLATLCFSWDGKPSRMEIIARARNIVLSYAQSDRYKNFDYVIMADLDFQKPWPIQEILKTIQKNDDWDCVCANGVANGGEYYDRYALRNDEFPFGPELVGDSWWGDLLKRPLKLPNVESLLPVYSAFGGLAIYKRASIIEFFYTGHVTDDLFCDYANMFTSLLLTNVYVKGYLKMIGKESASDLSKIPILFRENSGYQKYPVCCEHVTLHASMRLHGYGKIFINPKMVMKAE